MPELVLKRTGETRFVSSEGLSDALASGLYEAPAGDQNVQVTLPGPLGLAAQVPLSDLDRAQTRGADVESEQAFRGREREVRIDREHGGVGGKIITGVETGLNTASLGLTGAAGELLYGDEYTEDRLERAEANPVTATASAVAGTIVPAIASGGTSTAAKVLSANPMGAVSKIGSRIARTGEGASLGTKLVRGAAGAAVEGGAQGFGTGVQQLTDSTDPLTWEKATSVLSSQSLLGGTIGAGVGLGAGVVGRVAEKGLRRAKKSLDDVANRAPGASDDLATLDRKGLAAADTAEDATIEAALVPKRQALAEDLALFRREIKEQKHFLTTKDVDLPADGLRLGSNEIGRKAAKASQQLDYILDSPKRLAKNPGKALDALERQEDAYVKLLDRAEDLRGVFKADTTGARMAALDTIAPALERNRALQAQIADLSVVPTSARKAEIAAARDALSAGGGPKSMGQQMAGGAAYSAGAGAASMIPVIGPFIAPFVGAKASALVGNGLAGLSKATQAAAARSSKAIGAFLDVSAKAAPAVPVLATKVLSSVAYGPVDRAAPAPTTLAGSYKARSAELRSMVAVGPDGSMSMRPEARQKMAANLGAIRAAAPIMADRMETLAARRVEFLASKLPKRPDLGGIPAGPDRHQPSDMEMRTFARYAAGVEDPGAIVERLAAGRISPEDAEVMRSVYPEMLAEMTQKILEELPQLQKSLPYERRVALSILTGVPVDPAMSPRILRVLQASFQAEPGTEGGTQAPKPAPQFGSVKNQEATPSQERAGATV